MLDFLRRLWRPPGPATQRLEGPTRSVGTFMRPSTALVDSRDLHFPEKRRRYALFTYGAILCVAERQGLDETAALGILVRYLRSREDLHEQDVSHLVAACANLPEVDRRRGAVLSGREAMAEWLDGEAGSAVNRLAGIMHEPPT